MPNVIPLRRTIDAPDDVRVGARLVDAALLIAVTAQEACALPMEPASRSLVMEALRNATLMLQCATLELRDNARSPDDR